MNETHISRFRLRGWTCPGCRIKSEIFGHVIVLPNKCEICGADLPSKPDYDQSVVTKKVVKDFVP